MKRYHCVWIQHCRKVLVHKIVCRGGRYRLWVTGKPGYIEMLSNHRMFSLEKKDYGTLMVVFIT